LPSKFFGCHGSDPVWLVSNVSGASLMMVAGVKPFSSAAEYMKGLKLDPAGAGPA
jgi:hypothetical protein